MSKIEWTEATWNPLSGCSRISDGCQNCYAETMTKRLASMDLPKYQGLLNEQGRFNGVVRMDEDALLIPLKRRRPTIYFVNSMADLFHERVPNEWIDKIFAVMALCPQHRFQVLTKRAERMRDYFKTVGQYTGALADFWLGDAIQNLAPFVTHRALQDARIDRPLPNVWLGVSVENQKAADERIPHLLETPAAIRFLSGEPLLEPITIHNYLYALDWVIVGGESGSKARPCHVDWIESIVGQCHNANVPIFVKQMGSNCYDDIDEDGNETYPRRLRLSGKGGDPFEWPEDLRVREMPCRQGVNK